MHDPLRDIRCNTDAHGCSSTSSDTSRNFLDSSPESDLAYALCERSGEDFSPADYFEKLCAVHDLFDDLAEHLQGWLGRHGLEFSDLVGTIAGVREAEATAEVGATKDTGPQVRTSQARVAIRKLFLAGLSVEEMAHVLGLDDEAVAAYLDRTGYSPLRREAVELYRQGVGVTEIARRLKRERKWVYETLHQAGQPIGDGRTYSETQRRAVVRGYRAGKSIKELADKHQLPKATVVNILRAAKKAGECPEYPRSAA